MAFKAVTGGFALTELDARIVNRQKLITKQINDKFVQVGACFLKPASKNPLDEDWHSKTRMQTDLQQWIDDPECAILNVGFNLQLGWVDVDIDSEDPEYNRFIVAAMDYLEIDTRFRFGRLSVGVPTHALVKMPEEEEANYKHLKRFEPSGIVVKGKRSHTQIRSYGGSDKDPIAMQAKQTVVPGSLYVPKREIGKEYDISVWYDNKGEIASNVESIAKTTPRLSPFLSIVRAVTFGTIAYCLKDHWVEGSRQVTATKVTGWLARMVRECAALSNQEAVAKDVFCPVDTDSWAEKLIHFICDVFEDDEPHMRVRTYYDAAEKLERNPDAKVPGWLSLGAMLGNAELVQAIRTVITPGADVSSLTKMAERYVYDETDNSYIDRERHRHHGKFTHEGPELERRHKGDVIFLGGKPRESFKVFESSNIRKRVDGRDQYPDMLPGSIFRVSTMGDIVPDEYDGVASTYFNTWQGWQIEPIEVIDDKVMRRAIEMTDRMLAYITDDNKNQIDWLKQWMAWIRQYPGIKQQIAPVIVGGQGVGKSFWGNGYLKAIFGPRLWGTASARIVDDKFNIGPFKNKMAVFIDEVKFGSGDTGSVEEIKKLIRNTDISGMEKFEEARDYRIFARIAFASNSFNINVSQRNVEDRALFYIKATSPQSMGLSQQRFRDWAMELKPFYDEFNEALKDTVFVRHIVRYLCDLKCDRYEIESLKWSSGNDEDIVKSNMSWARRVAKSIIESGFIANPSLAFDYPFEYAELGERVNTAAKDMGFGKMMVDPIIDEFKLTGFYEEAHDTKGMKMLRFNKKWGDVVRAYSDAINMDLAPYRQLNDVDYGDNKAEFGDISLKRVSGRKSIHGF